MRWNEGETLFNHFLKNVEAKDTNSISTNLPLSFHSDGSRKYVELHIVNLQANEHGNQWEEIGTLLGEKQL